MNNFWEVKIDESLRQIYKNSYNTSTGTRSNLRIKNLHSLIVFYLNEKLNKKDDYLFKYSDENNQNQEEKISGLFYNKRIDISVYKKINNEWIFFGGIATKIIFSNLLQNSINYFEQMISETLNFRLIDKKYYQLILIRNDLPYFKNSKKGITKIEQLNESFYKKYYEYMTNDKTKDIRPNNIYIGKINYFDKEIIEKYQNKKENINFDNFSKELFNNLNNIKTLLSIDHFLQYDKITDEKVNNFFIKTKSFLDFLDKIIKDLNEFEN